jgi:branched-chain amino acid transport system permease protein
VSVAADLRSIGLGEQATRRAVPLINLVLLATFLGFTAYVAHGSYSLQGIATTAAVFAILALSLDLAAGMTGLYSLGHAGLFALGAYATTLINQHRGTNVLLLLPVVVIGVGLVGVVIGSLSLRVSGLYFAVTTLIFTLVVGVVLADWQFTGGLQGVAGPSFPDLPSGLAGLGSPVVWAVGLCLLVAIVLVWSLRSSPLYPVLLAIRDAEPFAASAGVPTAAVKVGAFGLSAGLAGMAGWAFAFLGFISPGQFSWTVSVNILVMVILGGMNTRLGPLLGAAFVSAFPVVVSIDPFLQEVLFGLVFVLVIVFVPEGAMGLLGRLWRQLRPVRPANAPAYASGELLALTPAHHVEDTDVVLAVRGVSFDYGTGAQALDAVDMTVRRGSVHGLIGPNGSGKSTLVNLISGALRPTAGSIVANGEHIEGLPQHAMAGRGLSRTFQSPVLVSELSTRRNVGIGTFSVIKGQARRGVVWPLVPSGHRDGRIISARAGAALGALGVSERWAGTRVADVPHGIEQLTQFAAATVARPSILLLDEPLAGLSPDEVQHVAELLRSLRDAGVTVIVVEHQTKFVFELCDEVTVLAAGQVVKTGSAAEVRQDNRVREVYLGQ